MVAPQPKGASRSLLVLVVDDEPLLLRLMERTLCDAGYGVLGSTDAPRTLELVASRVVVPDILVTDIRMVPLNGVDLAARIAALYPGVRVLLVSGWDPDHLELPWPFLRKPFGPDQLIEAVRRIAEEGTGSGSSASAG